MVSLLELVEYTDELLQSGRFSDYCPNGLQVEGRDEVRTIVSGVTASLALLEAAQAVGADAVLVHHGYFWKGENACVTGMKRSRLRQLLVTDTSLLAWHLPLDAHAELGNNAQLARVLGFERTGTFGDDGELQLACEGATEPCAPDALRAHIGQCLGREPLHSAGNATSISGRWVTYRSATNTRGATATNCAANLYQWFMLKASSTAPATSSASAPNTKHSTTCVHGHHTMMGTSAPSTMPQPPTRAIGSL